MFTQLFELLAAVILRSLSINNVDTTSQEVMVELDLSGSRVNFTINLVNGKIDKDIIDKFCQDFNFDINSPWRLKVDITSLNYDQEGSSWFIENADSDPDGLEVYQFTNHLKW